MTNTIEPSLRAVIYARVSAEEQKEGQTIDSRIAEMERFAASQGWPVIDVYKDEGWRSLDRSLIGCAMMPQRVFFISH